MTISVDAALANEGVVDPHHAEVNLKIGERLFNGLIPIGKAEQSCISCHAIHLGDTMNFNPQRHEVAQRAQTMDFNAFASVFGSDADNVSAQKHKDFKPDSLQLVQLHLFLKSLDASAEPAAKPSINKVLTVALLALFILVALFDLVFSKKIPYKPLHILAILFSVVFIVKIAAHSAIDLGRSKNYEPDQPIKFSHQVHAGNLKIDCFYCHTTADEGKSAGLPAANVCMNCHVIVREGSQSGKFEIAKLVEHVRKGYPHRMDPHTPIARPRVFFARPARDGRGIGM
ncbi:MAG: cytochrome c3 family protein [Breznakibacter sp.]